MSLLAGYESSSSEEEEQNKPVVAKPPPAITTTNPQKLFAPLPTPQRKQVNLRNLPLLMDKEDDEDISSGSEDEDNFVYVPQAPIATEEEPRYQPFTSAATTVSVGARMLIDDEDEEAEESTIAPTTADNAAVTTTASFSFFEQDDEDDRPKKRTRPAEELIREQISSNGEPPSGVTFDAEITMGEIRREAALLQQRAGGLLAVNLTKTQGITGKRNHQLSHIAQVAMKQKQDKQFLE